MKGFTEMTGLPVVQRLLTALAIIVAALATAVPANAASTTSVNVSGSTLFIAGTSAGETVNIQFQFGLLTVDSTSGITPGAGCSPLGATVVSCSTNVQFITAQVGGGNDTVTNNTSLQSSVLGGSGIDTLNGGPGRDGFNGNSGNDTLNGNGGNDTLIGNSEVDVANGAGGFDTCTAETESGCEA
jgi:Ca2+-binding RTX toxin-like protein